MKTTTEAKAAQDALISDPDRSDRRIAAELGLAPNTVKRARGRLEASGLIPYRPRPNDALAARRAAPGALWKPVAGWESLYEISDHGDVRSLRTGLVLKKRLMTQLSYVQYALCDGPRKEYRYAHRMVAEAFLGTPTGPLIRHLDDVKDNNHVSNLAYGDHVDNARDAIRNGRMPGRART